jgi:hypothetical protein
MTNSQKISMTPEELVAFVDAQIVKHEQAKEREAERIRRLQDPMPAMPATPLSQASPELMAAFNAASMPPRATWTRRQDGSL